LFAPSGIPAAIEAQLQQAMSKVLADPAAQKQLTAQGVELATATPTQLAAMLQDDMARWAKIVKASGATVD
jgi:tripartite-type tricarboxylate transporter receptor subunit TctC